MSNQNLKIKTIKNLKNFIQVKVGRPSWRNIHDDSSVNDRRWTVILCRKILLFWPE